MTGIIIIAGVLWLAFALVAWIMARASARRERAWEKMVDEGL